jgi:hypothetical protein
VKCLAENVILPVGITLDSNVAMQALELREAQQQLQVMQQAAIAEVVAGQKPGQVLLAKLADALADFLIERLLKQRSASRISFASRLGLSPQPRPPIPPAMLHNFLARAPDIAAIYPQHATYFALGAMPPSVSLLAAPLAAGTAQRLRGSQKGINSRHYLHSQCYATIGLEGQRGLDGAPQLPNSDLRLCGVLVNCLLDSSGRVRHIGAVDAMPSRVFRRARQLYQASSSSASILAALGSPGHVFVQGWWTHREEANAPAPAPLLLGAQPHAHMKSANVCELPAARHAKCCALMKDAKTAPRDSNQAAKPSEWGPADIGLERLQVACMLAWARERTLASHMRGELQGAGVLYEEQQMHQDPTEVAGGAGFGLRCVFLLCALPRRPPGQQLDIPEGFQAWPRVLGHAGAMPGVGDPPSASVESASIALTGPASWQLRVHGAALCAALRLSKQVDCSQNTSDSSRWQWQASSDEPGTIVREYSLHDSGCRLQHSWRDIAEVLLTKELFVAFAILQVHKPDAACCQAIRFAYPGVTIDVTLLHLQQLQVRVCAAVNAMEHIGFSAEAGTPLLELLVGHHLEHQIVKGQLHVFLSPVVSSHSFPSSYVFELALTKFIRSFELQHFLDALAHTTVGHRMLAVPPDLSGLSKLSRVFVEEMVPPYRLLLVFETHAMALQRPRRYACGLQLCAGGTALLHFDLRAQQVPRLVQEKLWPQASDSRSSSGKLPLEVLDYKGLVRQLCSGQTPLARLPPDPHAASFVEGQAGAAVIVQQGNLQYVLCIIAKHVDMHLPVPQNTVMPQATNAK